jgi:ubiquinone/menaquinone biosynthesis C-methylase UbiE
MNPLKDVNWSSNQRINDIDSYWRDPKEQIHRQNLVNTISKFLSDNIFFLDAGCGSGEVYKYLSPILKKKNITYLGVDGSIPFLDLARQRYKEDTTISPSDDWRTSFKTRFELQNLYALTFPNNTFDITMCIDVVQHCKHYELVIPELMRVTKQKLFLRTWVNAEKEDKLVHGGEMFDNIYSHEKLLSFLQAFGTVQDLNGGFYLVTKS